VTLERLLQIEELFHAGREGTAEERAALLTQADPEVRREVEALLSQSASEGFLDRPAIQNAVGLENAMAAGLVLGDHLGPYRIEDKLGEGGMGEVFRAVDTRLGRAVAIKVAHEQFSARFEREARAIAAMNHPNICTVYDVGPNYLVMELVEGQTLAARLKNGPLPISIALVYARQIAAALAEAHAKGIVHRDLKPGNLMIAKSGIKILDFGLARSGQDQSVTDSRMVMGTPAYMAPEQREGKPADVRSDIYSFGCMLYEMLTGTKVTSRRRRIPSRKLERIVSRCLEEDPDRRWQSAAELERELAGVAATGSQVKLIVAAAVGMAALLVAAYFSFHRVPKLTDKDAVVLADFANSTGDPVFDGTLRQGLAIQLEQSPFLKIMDDGRVQRDLGLMNLQPGARITNQVAHDICVREGGAAIIDGAIASLGKNYVITLQAITCQEGATLVREQAQAEDKEHVLNALGRVATSVRSKLGESLNSIQRLNRPLEQATTPSLEALQSYTEGLSVMKRGQFRASIPLLDRAIAIDPKFTMAYYLLGIAYEQTGDLERSAEYAKQAFSMIDRVSETERTEITAYYYRATGELDREIDAYQLAVRNNYPRSWGFHTQLGLTYIDLGQFEEGLKEGLEAARLEPSVEPPYRRELDALLCLDRMSEANEVEARVRALGIDGSRIHQRFLEMGYVEDDKAAIAREVQWFSGKPEEYLSFGLQAADLNVHGRRRESHELYRRAAEAALHLGLRFVADEFEEADARADALSGNCQTVRRLGRPALALAICGEAPRAEKLTAGTSKIFPNGTIWNAVQLPEIRAATALHRDEPGKSVELLASASPYERAYPDAVYVRGLAYLSMHKGVDAAAEFQKIVDHKGANWGATWVHPNWGQYYSLSYLGMARGFALAGDRAKAKNAFENFFALWKDADPDIPILKQAKIEYAKLQRWPL
jgi:eukaryotic-like serine/threonine-protein kinase